MTHCVFKKKKLNHNRSLLVLNHSLINFVLYPRAKHECLNVKLFGKKVNYMQLMLWVVRFNELEPQAFPVQMGFVVLQCVLGQPEVSSQSVLPAAPPHRRRPAGILTSCPVHICSPPQSDTKPAWQPDGLLNSLRNWIGQASLCWEECELRLRGGGPRLNCVKLRCRLLQCTLKIMVQWSQEDKISTNGRDDTYVSLNLHIHT